MQKQILHSAYPTDVVRGAPNHPKDMDPSLGTPTSALRSG